MTHPVLTASSLEFLPSWKCLSFQYLLNIFVGIYMLNLYYVTMRSFLICVPCSLRSIASLHEKCLSLLSFFFAKQTFQKHYLGRSSCAAELLYLYSHPLDSEIALMLQLSVFAIALMPWLRSQPVKYQYSSTVASKFP